MPETNIKITNKLIESLTWIKENQPVTHFNKNPSITYVKKLIKNGLVEIPKELVPHPKLNGGVSQHFISKEGMKILKSAKKTRKLKNGK